MGPAPSDWLDQHPYGLNVIGYPSANFGLAVACRNTIRLLVEDGTSLHVIDIEAGGGRSGHEDAYANLRDRRNPAPHPVNLFHMNPPDIVNLMIDHPRWLDLASRMNVCVPFWELPNLPPTWIPVVEGCDMVLCPSRFILDAVERSAPATRTVHYPQTVYLPEAITPDRSRWGLPEDRVLFLVSLDLGSDVERKNPVGVIKAFREAFADSSSVGLIVKLNNPRMSRWASANTAQLRAIIGGMPNVSLIAETMSYVDALSLYASCDVMCSLHRSEGLGLHLLEAMMLGIPVIATAWSGNLDFMDSDSGCLVGYKLVPAHSEHPSYKVGTLGEGQVWAEPNISEAAQCMRELARDPNLRCSIGSAARARAAKTQQEERRAEALAEVGDAYALRQSALADHSERADRLAALRGIPVTMRVRRLGGRALRGIGLRK